MAVGINDAKEVHGCAVLGIMLVVFGAYDRYRRRYSGSAH